MKSFWVVGCLVGILFGFAFRALLLISFGEGDANKDASNYWSTFSRIQEGFSAESATVLCGSSITGRLPGAGQGYALVANFGSDGGSGADGVSMIVEGVAPLPKQLIFETNTLRRYLSEGAKREVDPERPWFQAGLLFNGVTARKRISRIIYSRALGRSSVLSNQVKPFTVESAPVILKAPDDTEGSLSDLERSRLDELVQSLSDLNDRGCAILLVQFPSQPVKPEFESKHDFLVRYLSSRTGSPFWDLQTLVPIEKVKMTDAVHMGPESAARTLRTIEDWLGKNHD